MTATRAAYIITKGRTSCNESLPEADGDLSIAYEKAPGLSTTLVLKWK